MRAMCFPIGESTAHARLAPQLQAAIELSEGTKDFRRRLHAKIGPCAMVCNGMLTPMGEAIVERIAAFENHGMKLEPYNFPNV